MLTRSRKRAQEQTAARDQEALPFVPIEVLAVAFSFLDLRDQCVASRTSCDWRRAALVAFSLLKSLRLDPFHQDLSRFFSVNRFPSLVTLTLGHVSSLSLAQQLASCFPYLPSLGTLSFRKARMGDELFCVLASAFPALSSSLKFLYLQSNNLTDRGAKTLASVLSQLLLLEQLDLSNNGFGNEGLVFLSQAFTQLRCFHGLILLYCTLFFGFSPIATSALATALSSPNVARSLEHLQLSQFASGSLIVAVLPLLERLGSFTLLWTELNLPDLETIADICCARKCMTGLGVDLNNLGDDAIRVLLPALSENQKSLQQLHFTSGRITGVGLQLLGSCLSSDGFSQLRELRLCNNDFSTSIISFANDVLAASSCTRNYLSMWNRIGDDGAAALVSSFHHLTHLQVLDMPVVNAMSDVGLMSFLQLGLALPAPPVPSHALISLPTFIVLACINSQVKRRAMPLHYSLRPSSLFASASVLDPESLSILLACTMLCQSFRCFRFCFHLFPRAELVGLLSG